MDRLGQAEAVLAAAGARGALVITPSNVLSPMDCSATIPVPRGVIASCEPATADRRDAEIGLTTAEAGGMDAEMLRAATGRPDSTRRRRRAG